MATPKAKAAVCEVQGFAKAARNAALSLAAAATVALPTLVPVAEAFEANPAYGEMARLTAGDPIKNPDALLRNALPISTKPIRQIQVVLESISEDLRVPGVRFSGVSKAVNNALNVVTKDSAKILADVAPSKKDATAPLIEQLKEGLIDFKTIVDNKDKQQVPIKQQELLGIVGQIEENMIDGFPFEVPAEFAKMPLLKGRATLEMKVKYLDNAKAKNATMVMVLDGYNAPVTAGNFVDLVERQFYNGLTIDRSDGFVVQMGDPKGPEVGFVDPTTNKLRTIPLEIKVPKDKLPIYSDTLEDLRRATEDPALPFNAFGTMAMAREEFENDSASSQVFWLLKESELTPSGANLLDGRYAVFGYIIDNSEALMPLKVGDIIESIRVISGGENLVNASKKGPREAPPQAQVDGVMLAGDA
jgi:cyclophilin family peptidyl-prolyl cis-trans isomerase